MILVSEGSAGTVYTPAYYITDHLGSTRSIYDGSETIARSDFLPFGTRWDHGQAATSRYQFTGYEDQELIDRKYMDAGARFYDGISFNTIDPLAEKKPWNSPYAYAFNNPIRIIDPNGMDEWEYDEEEKRFVRKENSDKFSLKVKGYDVMLETTRSKKMERMDKIMEGLRNSNEDNRNRETSYTDYSITRSGEVGEIFLFLASNSNVEWGLDAYWKDGRVYVLRTSHLEKKVGNPNLTAEGLYEDNQIFAIHSHTGKDAPRGASGYQIGDGDAANIWSQYRRMHAKGMSIPSHYVYHQPSRTIYHYDPWIPNQYIRKIKSYQQGLNFLIP